MKLGCGQSEASEMRVSRPTGAKVSVDEPLNTSSDSKVKAAGG